MGNAFNDLLGGGNSGGAGGLFGGLLGGGGIMGLLGNPIGGAAGMVGGGLVSALMPLIMIWVGLEVALKLVDKI